MAEVASEFDQPFLRAISAVADGWAVDRSIAWYEKHFPGAGAEGVTNVQP